MDADVKPAEAPAPIHEPLHVGDHVVVHGAQPVDIGGGRTVALQILLDNRNPRCPYCTEGFVRRIEANGTVTKVCACCVDRYRKKAAQSARAGVAPAQVVRVADLVELERGRRRVERLTRDAAALTDEIAAKERRLESNMAELTASAARLEAEAQDHASGLLADQAERRRLQGEIGEMQSKLLALHQALIGANDSARAREEARTLALTIKADAEAEIGRRREAFEGSVRGLRRDLERVQRRLARARAYNGLPDAEPAGDAA